MMIPRGRLDVSFIDIFSALSYCVSDWLGSKRRQPVSEAFEQSLYCLSVRSGFDLVLRALELPAGSEILVSDISIPAMFEIIEANGLKAVSLPVDKLRLGISTADLEAAISPRSKAIVLTHLFGSLMETERIRELARERGLLLIEDCAQAYVGNSFLQNCESDISLFSFGMIKTNTALGGALVMIRDRDLREKVAGLQEKLPLQATGLYFKKLVTALMIQVLSTPLVYSLFYNCLISLKKDPDEVLSGFTRGFPGADLLNKIRYRPSGPLLKMLERRIRRFDHRVIEKRTAYGLEIMEALPSWMQVGSMNRMHSFWVLPVECANPEAFVQRLRAAGFDATMKASSLVKLRNDDSKLNADELLMENLVYLPMWPGTSVLKKQRLKGILCDEGIC